MMHTMTRRALGPVVVGLGLLGLAGCGGGGYDRQDAVDQLVTGGATETQANCMLDEMETTIGKDRLGERSLTSSDELTAEEQAAVTNAALKCLSPGG